MVEKLDFKEFSFDFDELLPEIFLIITRLYSDYESFMKENLPSEDLEKKKIELNQRIGSFEAEKLKKFSIK